ENYFFSFTGYFLDYTLAPIMGYSLETQFAGLCHFGLSTFRASGQGVFYAGIWVAT
ncbi:Os04g0231266, partial [Oryza sativa Japonica Group]